MHPRVRSNSLPTLLRGLLYLSAVSYLLVGLVMFLAPEWTASSFAWRVSPFVAMTIGAWCIGNGVISYQSARFWRWEVIHPALIYLWAFALTEAGVLVLFRDRVTLTSAIAWAYVFTLLLAVVAALAGLVDALARRRPMPPLGAPIPPWLWAGMIFFMVVVGTLSLGGIRAQAGGLATEGELFPEPLTLFTVRAFAVFFGSLVLAGIPLLRSRGIVPLYFTVRAAIWLIIPILVAAVVNLGVFDFAARPLGLGYLTAYIGTLVVSIIMLWRYRESAPSPVNE